MFEKKPNQPNQPDQGGSPGNLPLGQPASISPTPKKPDPVKETPPMEASKPENESPAKLETEPEDILGDIDKVEPNIKGPAEPKKPDAPIPPAVEPPEKPITKEPFFKAHQKQVVMGLIVIVVLGVLGVGGWYGYSLFFSKSGGGNLEFEPDFNVNVDTNEAVNTNAAVINTNQPPPQPIDTDRDGLTDEEEEMYGTDKNEVDTDKDGLTDRDEIKVFKTDPNDPDTDGDTYLDGDEVRAGYDPNGDGRLLKIE